MIDSLIKVDFSAHELHLLLSVTGPFAVLGLEDPYLGLLADEVEGYQREALQSLLDRDLVRMVTDDEIAIAEDLAAVLTTFGDPVHSVIVTHQVTGESLVDRFIHYDGNRIVEHVETQPGMHLLSEWDTASGVAESIAEQVGIQSLVPTDGVSFVIGEDVLHAARDAIRDAQSDEGIDMMIAAGIDKKSATALAQSLQDAISSSSVVVVIRNRREPSKQNVRGLAILRGGSASWLMRPMETQGISQVEFTGANPMLAQERLMAILP